MDLVSVVVPALDEGPTLEELFERVDETFRQLGRAFEFILVDDGSSDNTSVVAAALGRKHANFSVIQHARNQGKAIALMQGFEAARGETLVTLDGDLQDRPEMIPRLLEKIAEGYDLVNGLRLSRRDGNKRRFVSRIYNRFVSRVFDCPLGDVNCGLKAMRRDVYKGLELHGDLHRLIPILATLQGFKITEVPVEHDERKVGTSRYRLIRHRGILDVVALMAINTSQTRPFHFFCELAFLFWGLAGVAFGLWILLAFGVWGGEANYWHTIGTLLGGLGTWAAFVGTVLPLFGLFLEMEARRFQDIVWRRRLVTAAKSSEDN